MTTATKHTLRVLAHGNTEHSTFFTFSYLGGVYTLVSDCSGEDRLISPEGVVTHDMHVEELTWWPQLREALEATF